MKIIGPLVASVHDLDQGILSQGRRKRGKSFEVFITGDFDLNMITSASSRPMSRIAPRNVDTEFCEEPWLLVIRI